MEKGILLKQKINFIKYELGEDKEKELLDLLHKMFNINMILPAQWYDEKVSLEINNFIRRNSYLNVNQRFRKLGEFIANNTIQKSFQKLYSGFTLEQKIKMILNTFNTLWHCLNVIVKSVNINRVEIVFPPPSSFFEDSNLIVSFFETALSLTNHFKVIVSGDRKELGNLVITVEAIEEPEKEETLEIFIEDEAQIVQARQKVKIFAEKMGFKVVDTTRIVTCVSELARNIVYYAGKGYIYLKEGKEGDKKYLFLQSVDKGPGIKNLDEILEGNYKSEKGLGMGLRVIKRLSDDVKIFTEEGKGTTVELKYYLQ